MTTPIRVLKAIDHITKTGRVKIPRFSLGHIIRTFRSNNIGDVHKVQITIDGVDHLLMLHPNEVEAV